MRTASTRVLDRSGFRPEVQALRAVAVLAVVLNHLWPDRLGGGFVGVDVFFVISGYLITSHLLREVARTGRIRLGAFWARRARRLLPASLLVLAVAAVGVALWVPIAQWAVALRQILASALYVQNWILAADAVDYFASSRSASPVTHYWSLSAEEQFYVVWPLLILVAVVLTRGARAHLRSRVLVIVLGVVVLSSFVCSVVVTAADPSAAYFVTPTRAWEFGLGGLLAAAPPLVGRQTARGIAGWAGWATILASAVLLSPSTPFPGAIALAPVLGTILVIAAGDPTRPWASSRFARVRPVQFVGDVSYSLYLWHWPLVILLPHALGRELGAPLKAGVLVVAILLAWATKRFVEDPARTWVPLARGPGWRTGIAVVVAMAVVVVPTGLVVHDLEGRIATTRAALLARTAAPSPCFGAAARALGSTCDPGYRLVDPDEVLVNAGNQGNQVLKDARCQQDPDLAEVVACEFGAPRASASLNAVVVGDSHAGHWIGAVERIAAARSWHVDVLLKSSCAANLDPLLTARFYPAGAPSCHTWAKDVTDRIALSDADLVVTSSIAREYGENSDSGPVPLEDARSGLADGYVLPWTTWLDAGKKVAVIADVPTMDVGDIPDCLSLHLADVDPCTTPADVGLPGDPMVAAAARIHDPRFVLIDLTSLVCDATTCHSVVGGLMAFGDANHLTNAFSRTTAPYLAARLDPILEPTASDTSDG